MAEKEVVCAGNQAWNGPKSSNVKDMPETAVVPAGPEPGEPQNTAVILTHCENAAVAAPVVFAGAAPKPSRPAKRYERFGETIRYLTMDEWNRFLDCVDEYRHKLMFRLIYHLGCRVGEFVRIQLKHLDFSRSSVLIPAENTKTHYRRTSHVPRGLMNEVKSMLRREGRMLKRLETMPNPDDFLFRKPGRSRSGHYSENRVRQIFQRYVKKSGLDREYATDSKGRKLHQITVHSLRHSHIMHHIHVHKLPLPIVQKQVGHRTLSATSVYLNPSEEAVGKAYERATNRIDVD